MKGREGAGILRVVYTEPYTRSLTPSAPYELESELLVVPLPNPYGSPLYNILNPKP